MARGGMPHGSSSQSYSASRLPGSNHGGALDGAPMSSAVAARMRRDAGLRKAGDEKRAEQAEPRAAVVSATKCVSTQNLSYTVSHTCQRKQGRTAYATMLQAH